MEENGTAVNKLSFVFVHCLGSGLWAEDAIVALPTQLRVKERVVLVRFYFLGGERERERARARGRKGGRERNREREAVA